jgi:archaellum component FlaC
MAHRTDDIQQDIEDTQRDIDDTRSAMTEKLELLGEHVRETVEGAQASVEEMVENVRDTVDTTVAAVKQTVEGAQASVEGIVENVKGTVGETVEAVQRTFDLHHQMEQHPWLLCGGAVLVGYLLGSGGNGRTAAVGSAYEPRFSPASPTPVSSSESSTRPQPQQGTGSGDLGRFTDEIAAIKSAAVGAVVSTLWGMFKQALPPSTPPLTSTRTKQSSQSSDRPVQTPAAMSSTAINGSAIV